MRIERLYSLRLGERRMPPAAGAATQENGGVFTPVRCRFGANALTPVACSADGGGYLLPPSVDERLP
jgi:hypothetical protein